MKRTLLTFSVCAAILCGSLVYATTGQNRRMTVVQTEVSDITAKAEKTSSYGVSIGTVDARDYSTSGLNFNNFDDVEYVAQTSEGTYIGFELMNDSYTEDGQEIQVDYINLTAINSSEETVTIPDSIRIADKTYPIERIIGSRNLRDGFNSNIKSLTVPATVNSIYIDYQFDRNLESIYMLGEAPYISSPLMVPNVYVCNKSHLAGYLNNDNYSNSTILPFGWDFDWVTVNVEKNGEFAETYLTQNNYNWDAAQYVKVTGNINDIDLSAIKNLTSLIKLDLSETTITTLPEEFMYNRASLKEVKLPATVESIGNSAFYGCFALQSFDLNGITEIGSSVFRGCNQLSYINLNGVQSIGDYAFYGCSKLNNIDLSTVEHIGYSAFSECISLESVDLASAITIGTSEGGGYSSGGNAFQNCISLKNVLFGNKLMQLAYGDFENTGVENITIPEGLSKLPSQTFRECKKLSSIELPSSLTVIDSQAFSGCTSLSSLSLKTGLTTIAERAFEDCSSLEEIVIPSTVTSIGQNAFDGTGIKSFKCYAVVPPATDGSFIGNNMDMSRTYLYVPPFSKDFYRNTQYWSNFYLMRSIEDQIDYIFVDRPITINLEEEDNDVVANNPQIVLSTGPTSKYGDATNVGQLTATGAGTLSAGNMTINTTLATRSQKSYQYCPTLINYADRMRADNVTVKMSLYNYYSYRSDANWYFISLPFDVKVSEIIPSDNTYWVIRRYDSAARAAGETSSTWVNLTNEDTMEAGKGYIVSAVATEIDEEGYSNNTNPCLNFTSGNTITKNNLFRPTDIIVPLTEYTAEFAHNRSWNLIGNPYPCYFDMHYLNEEFTAPITIWNGESYIAYSPVDDDLVLSPYEAFFVQCPLNATEMIFKETGRMHAEDGKTKYKSPAKIHTIQSAEERNVFNFEVSNDKSSDRARIVMNPDATIDYEIGRDASKFFSDNTDCAQLYVAADVNYSICERPVNNGIATLGIRSSKEETYTLSLTGRYSSEWHVIITDNVTGITVDLTEQDYQFATTKGDSNTRFSVKFQLGGQSGIDSIISDFGAESNVTVTAIDGKTVYSGCLSEMEVPSAGIYIISNGKETRKVILK